MSLSKERFEVARHCMILTAELARGIEDGEDFLDAIPLYDKPSNFRELTTLALAHRAFREASTDAVEALLKDRHVRAIR